VHPTQRPTEGPNRALVCFVRETLQWRDVQECLGAACCWVVHRSGSASKWVVPSLVSGRRVCKLPSFLWMGRVPCAATTRRHGGSVVGSNQRAPQSASNKRYSAQNGANMGSLLSSIQHISETQPRVKILNVPRIAKRTRT
jgi:hypothetical protein